MTEEGNTGLTWERRLALWLPRPILFGAFLIAAGLSTAYLIFQWFFDLRVERNAILLAILIAFLLMMRRYTAPADVLERQRFGLEVPLSDRPVTEVRLSVLACRGVAVRKGGGTCAPSSLGEMPARSRV